ncbi:ATP-binding protein [Streptomyces gamaensis]|uniref:ATP-binding protein n=1 Tax=Streptomyces gamaensis TaxID=1763542 RepID=A0ABW0YUJ3_9ACTN
MPTPPQAPQSPHDPQQLRIRVDMAPDHPEAITRARRITHAWLRYWSADDPAQRDALHDTLTVVSELLTNVYRHVDDRTAQLLIRYSGNTVQVEVADNSPALPAIRPPHPESLTGRGLPLVHALCSTVETLPEPIGKRIRCTLRHPCSHPRWTTNGDGVRTCDTCRARRFADYAPLFTATGADWLSLVHGRAGPPAPPFPSGAPLHWTLHRAYVTRDDVKPGDIVDILGALTKVVGMREAPDGTGTRLTLDDGRTYTIKGESPVCRVTVTPGTP